MAANPGKLKALLDKAIELGSDGSPSNFAEWREAARSALKHAYPGDPAEVERFDKIKYSLSVWSDQTPQSSFDNARRGGVRVGIEMLKSALTHIEISEPTGAAVDVAGLHAWFAAAAASLWDAGQHRAAVETAGMTVETQLKAKLGLTSGAFSHAALQAFNTAPPTAKEKRLRFVEFTAGTDSWTNAHEGAWYFGRGCAMRIRNLISHGHEPPENEALECLAALSLYARWVEQAVVESAP